MSVNPLALKIAAPYARALFDFSVEKNIMHQITADFQNLDIFLEESTELTEYLKNPIVSKDAKAAVLTKTLQSQVNAETFKFLMVLVQRERINLLKSVISSYLELVYETASIKMIEVSTAFPFANLQKNTLIQKLKELTNAREIRLVITVDSSLIGGFLIKTESKVIDFTIKNQLQQLAKQIFTLLAHEEGIALNLDILETGLLNILALLGILIYTGKDFLGSLLEERKTTIVKSVQDAEDRLNEAQKRLSEAQKQLNQANLVIGEIKNETVATKKVLLESDAYDAKKDLKIRFDRALATFRSKERQIFLEIKQQIISLVLKRTVIRAQEAFGPKERATALINDTINKLEGDLL